MRNLLSVALGVAAWLSALPLPVAAQAAWMPEYGEAATGRTITSITSLHANGPDETDEEGMPKGWPAAQDPSGVPLYVKGENGQFLLMPALRGDIVRAQTSPSHYQTETAFVRNPEHDGRQAPIGHLVQRANGDVLGVYSRGDSEHHENPAPFGFFRLDFDGTHGSVIESTLGKLNHPSGVLVVDGNKVYGTDLGEDGNGRLFRLNEDDSVEILHEFGPGPQGQKRMPNGLIQGADGKLYGLVAYDRGLSFEAGTSTDPQTPTGALYRLEPDVPGSYTVLKTFTLAEGELMTLSQGFNRTKDYALAYYWLVEREDWLYGTMGIGQCGIPANGGRRYHPLCGWQAQAPHWLTVESFPYYDVPETVFGAVWRMRADGSDFQIIHRFSHDDGSTPLGPLAVGEDGAIYGTTVTGGLHESFQASSEELQTDYARGRWFQEGNPPYETNFCKEGQIGFTDGVCRLSRLFYSRDGVLYRIVPERIQVDAQGRVSNGGFELVHHFRNAETGRSPIGVVRASDGRLYGATAYGGGAWINKIGISFQADDEGTVFMVSAQSEAAVTLTVTPAEVMPGDKVELTWTSHQVRDCMANSSRRDWMGSLAPEGSMDLYPTDTGVYNYSLTCIDESTGLQVSSLQVLRVNTAPTQVDGNTVEYSSGGSVSMIWLVLLLAVIFSWRARFAAAISLTGVKA